VLVVAPVAPGGFIYECGRAWFALPHVSSWIEATLAITLSLLVLCGLAAGLRRAGNWRSVVASLALLAFTWLAHAVLSVVRA